MTIASYDYTPAVMYAIDLISQGRTKTSACDESNVSITTFDNYIKTYPELKALYEDADQRGADAMAEALVEIDHHGHYGQSDPKMAKVISDNIKWLLSKRKPKDYGDKIEVKHTITADKAITQALLMGQQRALEASQEVIDADFTIMEDEEDMSFLS